MEPTSLPESEDGWIRDPRALHTIFALNAMKANDEIMYRSNRGVNAPVIYTRMSSDDHARWVCEVYANPEVATKAWVITAWRRPKRES